MGSFTELIKSVRERERKKERERDRESGTKDNKNI